MSGGIYGRPIYWRATMQPARMLFWDARLAPVVGLFVLHARLWTLLLLAASLALAAWCEYRGLSIPGAARAFRSFLAGRRRRATSRPPRGPACYSGECADGMVWDPALAAAVPPPLWARRADRRTARMAEASAAAGDGEPPAERSS